MFYFVVKNVVTTVWRHNHFKSAFCSFFHAIATEVRAWRLFSVLVEVVVFFSVIKLLVTRDFFYFNSMRLGQVSAGHSKWGLLESS